MIKIKFLNSEIVKLTQFFLYEIFRKKRDRKSVG